MLHMLSIKPRVVFTYVCYMYKYNSVLNTFDKAQFV